MAQQQTYRVNRQIRVREVRLIDQDGEQVGIVPTQEAFQRAQDAELDIVEVAPTARPPVCRIMDYGKFKYEQAKKERTSGKPKQVSKLRELRVRPAITDHDLSYRLEAGRRFLQEGNKVNVVCVFRGRQMAHPEMGRDVMRRVAAALEDVSKIENHPRMSGNRMSMLLARR